MSARPWSLSRRLLVTLGAATLLTWCASSVWLYRTALGQSDLLFDAALDQTAHAVLAVVRNEASELADASGDVGVELPAVDKAPPGDIVYQVRGPNGGVAYRSPGAPALPLAVAAARGFSAARIEGQDFRVFTLATDDGAATIHVAQPLTRRIALAQSGAVRLLAPGAVLMVLLAFAVVWSVRSAIAPVVRYASVLDERAADSELPVPAKELPAELQPVARAIDGLLARVRDALIRERTLTADAAHELRTPLAALRLQAQVALRSTGSAERAAALDELLEGTDRAARMVDSVLMLARYDARRSGDLMQARVDLSMLANLVAREFQPLASQQGTDLVLAVARTVVIGDEDALAIALRNLVGNALRYARQEIRIEVGESPDGALLAVRDDGRGFATEVAERAFDRFFRGPDKSEVNGGTGLGLALVRRIADLHHGSVRIVPGIRGGAGVEMCFPLASERAASGLLALSSRETSSAAS